MGLGTFLSGVVNQVNPWDDGRTAADATRQAQWNAMGYDPSQYTAAKQAAGGQNPLTYLNNNPVSTITSDNPSVFLNSNAGSATSSPQVASVTDTRDSGYYTGTGSSGSYDPTAVLNANDIIAQANLALSRLGTQGQVGTDNINTTYGNYRAGLQNNYNRDQADYNQNKVTTTRQNEQTKNTIDQRVAARANGLSRYLGANGAGDSQANYLLAPYAAARTGTQQRNQVNQAYGANMQALDQSWNRYNTDYQNSLLSLADQEKQARDQLQASLLDKEVAARNQLAQGQAALNYAQTGDAAQSQAIRNASLPGLIQLLAQIDALGRIQSTPQIADPTYTAPSLKQYTIDNIKPTAYVDNVQAESVSPFYQYLFKKQQDNNLV